MSTIQTHVSLCESCNAGYDESAAQCPYCHADRMMSNRHALQPLVFDTECYRHYWLLRALNLSTGEIHTFEMFEGHPLDVVGIRNLLTSHICISFNGIKYDMPMITYALSGASCSALKDASDAIITQQMQPWEFYRSFGLNEPTSVNHVDLIEVAPGTGSLKAYGGKMHTRKLQDLPYPPDMMIEWPHRVMLREYCLNDLHLTADLWVAMRERISIREKISDMYGIDVRSKSDPQIAEARMRVKLGRSPKAPIVQTGHQFLYKAPPWLKFKHLDIDELLKTSPFAITESGSVAPAYHATFIDWPDTQLRLDPHGEWVKRPKGWVARPLIINGTQYAMGIGGLHSMESSTTWVANDDMSLTMPDVGSYYPSLMLETGIYPAAIGPEFIDIFREKYKSRLAAKARANEIKNDIKLLSNLPNVP